MTDEDTMISPFVAVDELVVGHRYNVWWKPEGARLLCLGPYTGPFDFVIGTATFEDDKTKSGSSSMSLTKGMWLRRMPCPMCGKYCEGSHP